MFIVIQKYFDNGKVEATIEERTEAEIPKWMKFNHCYTKSRFDLYYNSFQTLKEAEKFRKQCFKA